MSKTVTFILKCISVTAVKWSV